MSAGGTGVRGGGEGLALRQSGVLVLVGCVLVVSVVAPREADATRGERVAKVTRSKPKPKARAETKASRRAKCLDPAADAEKKAVARWGDLGGSKPTLARLGDIDGDGTADLIVSVPSTCGTTGCHPYFVYASPKKDRKGACGRFIGSFDGEKPEVLKEKKHGIASLTARAGGLYVDSEVRHEFDGKKYMAISKRERDCLSPGGCVDEKDWGEWSDWLAISPAVRSDAI